MPVYLYRTDGGLERLEHFRYGQRPPLWLEEIELPDFARLDLYLLRYRSVYTRPSKRVWWLVCQVG